MFVESYDCLFDGSVGTGDFYKGVGLRLCLIGRGEVSSCRKNLVANKVQTNLAFGFFWLVEEVTLNGIGYHSSEFVPGISLGEDGFR